MRLPCHRVEVIAFFNFVDRLADASGVRVEAARINFGMRIADSSILHSSSSPLTQGLLNPRTITVAGFASCPHHQTALGAASMLVQQGLAMHLVEKTFASRDEYRTWLFSPKGREAFVGQSKSAQSVLKHTSSPFVASDESYVGGCDDLLALVSLLVSSVPTPAKSKL